MNCPTCHHPIPAPDLTCRDCFAATAWKALQATQHQPLREVMAGKTDLLVRSYKGIRHIKMFWVEQAFCKEPITDKHAKGHMAWETATLGAQRGSATLGALVICGGCRDALNRLMEEACRK